jgi:hypothetical protein
MQGLIAHFDRYSVGAVGTGFASMQFRREPPASLRATVVAEGKWESLLAPIHNKVEPDILPYGNLYEIQIGIVSYETEQDQWEVPGESASANASIQLLAMPLYRYSIVVPTHQLLFGHSYALWNRPIWTNAFDRALDRVSVGVSEEGCQSGLWYKSLADNLQAFAPKPTNLEHLYHIEDSEDVTAFLTQNAFLRDLLVEAHEKIVEFFGEDVNLHLELVDDPDLRGDRQLYAVIFTPLSVKEAITIQEQLDDAWWLDNLARARGKFNIIVEYV